ncbi:MAG: GTP cyclohydrolase I, partial [Chthoniobacterales bacterium]
MLRFLVQNNKFEIAERLTRKPERLEPDRLAEMERVFGDLLDAVGEDRERQGLLKTPGRAARSFEFLTQGYRQSVDEVVNGAIFDSDASEIVMVQDIELYSMC